MRYRNAAWMLAGFIGVGVGVACGGEAFSPAPPGPDGGTSTSSSAASFVSSSMATSSTSGGGSSSDHGHDGGPPSDAGHGLDAGPGGDGGPPSDAGHGLDAGPGGDGGSCPVGTVTFEMDEAAGDSDRYCAGNPGTCASPWVTVRSSDGTEVPIVAACETDCAACLPVGCSAVCEIPSELTSSGVSQTWDGTTYPQGTCGSANLRCMATSCAAPGEYVATMCAYPAAPITPTDASVLIPAACASQNMASPSCVDVPFTWPPPMGSETVRATIGADASATAVSADPTH